MEEVAGISSPLGRVRLRPENAEDEAFRFLLFLDSRPAEFALLGLDPAALDQLMRFQFKAQAVTYRARFPAARFDIIELAGEPIGRIVVNRSEEAIHIVDQAITPRLRNRGLGTAVMRALMDDAAAAGLALRLKVAASNDAAIRLYRRLGFVTIAAAPDYLDMARRGGMVGEANDDLG